MRGLERVLPRGRVGFFRWLALLVLPGFLMTADGCVNFSRPYQEVFYYHVDYSPPPVAGMRQEGMIVRLGSFNAAPSYQSLKIVYSTSTHRRKSYDYHHWVVSPSDMLAELLERDMTASGLYSAVVSIRSSLAPHYELEGTIEEIYEKDEGEAWYAVLSVRCAAFAYPESFGKKQILYQKVYRSSVRTVNKTPEGVVRAMSDAVKDLSRRIQEDLNAAIVEHEKRRKVTGE